MRKKIVDGHMTVTADSGTTALAFFLGVFAGFAKEILWDAWMRKGQFSWHDIVCDIAGSVIGIVIVIIGVAIC